MNTMFISLEILLKYLSRKYFAAFINVSDAWTNFLELMNDKPDKTSVSIASSNLSCLRNIFERFNKVTP